MINRTTQLAQQIAHRFPIGPVISDALGISSKTEVVKAKSIFQEKKYFDKKSGALLAQLTHYNDYPIIEIYTNDPELRATAQANLTAQYMIEFYLQYIQFLPVAARLNSGMITTDPMTYINDEVRRRQLNFSFVDTELHYFLKEFNLELAKYNETQSSASKINLFSMDDLKALMALCDVYKGVGCSAAVRTEKTVDGKQENQLIRNLDWRSLNVLGSNTLGFLTRTQHSKPEKPHTVFSSTFTPGILGLSMANDRGLVITLNEATTMKTKRENFTPNATPQFILIRELIENCATLQEVKNYLKTHQPATSHILTVMDAEGSSGVFEMLPNKGEFKDQLYRFRGFDKNDNQSQLKQDPTHTQHVSNHFLDAQFKPIHGSEGFDCSFKRYEKMEKALQKKSDAIQVAQSASVEDTVNTLIFKQQDSQLSVAINWANSDSGHAPDKKSHAVQYTQINLSKQFKEFSKKAIELKTDKLTATMSEDKKLDNRLIALMRLSQRVGEYHPELGRELSQFYSSLNTAMSQQNTISHTDLLYITDLTIGTVTAICFGQLKSNAKAECFAQYEKQINQILKQKQFESQSLLVSIGTTLFGAASAGLACVTAGASIPATVGVAALGSYIGFASASTVEKSIYNTPSLTIFSSRTAQALSKVTDAPSYNVKVSLSS